MENPYTEMNYTNFHRRAIPVPMAPISAMISLNLGFGNRKFESDPELFPVFPDRHRPSGKLRCYATDVRVPFTNNWKS